jgi:site-specific recombinase XerD
MKKKDTIINNYITYLDLEKGLSKNTLLAYKTDIKKFSNFFEKKNFQFIILNIVILLIFYLN